MNPTLRALNGFGLGARAGERQRVGDPRGWLRAQLQGAAPLLSRTGRRLAECDCRCGSRVPLARASGRSQQRREARQQARRALVGIAAAESRAAVTERVTTERPFVERLVAFWSNHLCVSAGAKMLVAPLAGSYEREAIRPHVLGRFEDMVLASAKHPAMLVYLDNFQSIGPSSRGAQAAAADAAAARAQRELRARAARAAHARRRRRLHAAGRAGAREDPDRLDGRRAWTWRRRQQMMPQRGAAAPCAAHGRTLTAASDSRFRSCCTSPERRPCSARDTPRPASRKASASSARSCRHPSTARFRGHEARHAFRRDDAAARLRSIASRACSATPTAICARSPARSIDLPEAWSDGARKFRTPQDWLVAVLRAFDAHDVSETTMPRAAAAAASAVVAAGAERVRRHDAGVGRSRLAAESRRAGAHHRAPPQRAARSIPRMLLDVVDVPPAIRCTSSSPTTRLPPTSASRSRWRARHSSGDDHESPHLRPEHVPRRHRDVRLPRRQLRAGRSSGGRFVFVLLRGGFDGLAAVVPYGDPAYRSLRGAFAFEESDLVDAERHVRAGARPRAAARALAARRAGRAARDGDPVSHAQPLRRPGDSRDRASTGRSDRPTAG